MTDTNSMTDALTEVELAPSRELTADELADVSGGTKTLGGRAKIVDGRFVTR